METLDLYARIRQEIKKRRLRPLGNRQRLTQTNEDTYDVRLLLFRDRTSATTYYAALKRHALATPPPFVLEIMLAFIPKTIFPEKYAVVLPNEKTDNRPGYREWASNSVWTANETLRLHNSTDHKYKELSKYAAEVYAWDLLCPAHFDAQAPEFEQLLSDPPGAGFNVVNYVDPDAPPPEKPEPRGPWIGVLIGQAQFKEPLTAITGTRLLLKQAGAQNFLGTLIHGADIEHPGRCWCVAVHTASEQQAAMISERVRDLREKQYLSFIERTVVREPDVSLADMPYVGYVSDDGRYTGP